ncbi:mechanosensitive ion channel family protein, partial [Pararhodospirillum oryzae]|uniref:mechanosensitive ion channel family protein n=1 Tax=Pararhodospirillum oryzae TaxID=478448 RepID=UPI0011BEC096
MASVRNRCPPSLRLVLGLMIGLGLMGALVPAARAADNLGPGPAPAAPAPVVRDTLGRDTPEGMVRGLLKAMAEEDYTRAAQYLDIPSRRSARRGLSAEELAQGLQQVLDKGGWLEANSKLSTAPEGRLDDGLDPDLERFASVRTPDGTVDLIAQRVDGPNNTPIWIVSGATMTLIPKLMEQVETGLLDRWLPPELSDGLRLWGVPLAHWGALLALAAVAYAGAGLLTALVRGFAYLLWRHNPSSARLRLIDAAQPPLRVCLAVWLFAFGGIHLGVSVIARQVLGWAAEMVGWVGLAWFLWRIVDAVGAASIERSARQRKVGALAALRFFRRASKGVVIGGATIIILDAFGVDVSAGLAALGIGGLAVALGAQKLIENLVGSLMLIADRPIREGDFCRFGGTMGTVEDIGMRSTRIRTLNRTVVTVPNGALSALEIENYSRRDMFWFHPILSLRLETTPDQIRHLLVTLRDLLYAHPRVDPDPARVRFLGLGADALKIEIFAYVHAEDYSDFLEVQEDLTLQVMDRVRASGAAFALPSQTLYMGRDSSPDPAARAAAEAQVKAWRETNTLPLPRFPEPRIEGLKGTVPYPPAGSASHAPPEVALAPHPDDAPPPEPQPPTP